MRKSSPKFALILSALLVFSAFGTHALARQDTAEPTVSALQTQVADLTAENQALQTQVAGFVTPTPAPERTPVSTEPVEVAAGLVILSYRFIHSGLYRAEADDKATWVVGEMQNTTDSKLDAPVVRFVLTDDGGNIIGSIDADPILPVILPGQVMPFQSAIFGDEPNPDEWSAEEISLCSPWGSTDRLGSYDPSGLSLQDVDIAISEDQAVIKGKVQNDLDSPASGVWIKAAVYSASGEFSGWFWTFIEVDIPAGKSARFEMNSFGDPHDPVGVAGKGYSVEMWVGFDSQASFC